MIEWEEIDGLHVGIAGGKRVFEVVKTCEDGFAVVNNIGNPVPHIKDKDNNPYTLENAKTRSEEMFKGWLESIGIDYYV